MNDCSALLVCNCKCVCICTLGKKVLYEEIPVIFNGKTRKNVIFIF